LKSKQKTKFKDTEIGKIQEDWNVQKLDDIVETILDRRGITPKKLDSDWTETGWSVISAKNVKNGQLIRKEKIRFVNDHTYHKWMNKKIKTGDIILTSEGPLGELFLVEDFKDFCIGQRLFAIRNNPEKIDSKFLFFYLSSVMGQNELSARATGSTVSGIKQEELREILVCFPKNLNKQQRIGNTLYFFNKQIQNLQNQNKILEQIIQSIFKSWFVDFDGQTKFVDSELGQIPEGWKIYKVHKLGKIITGKTPSTKNSEYFGDHIPFLTPSDNLDDKFIQTTERKLSKQGFDLLERICLPPGSIAVSCIGSDMGKSVLIKEPTITNQQFNSIIPNDIGDSEFLYYYFTFIKQELKNLGGGGTALPILKKSLFSEIIVLLPSKNILESFNCKSKPVSKLIEKNLKIILILKNMCDSLLPKLISGELVN
jgi:type I restriction enzyme, S subunit